ncbi:hypothetical protein ACA910_008205 [Epithemia clementina (nom. ined.)]
MDPFGPKALAVATVASGVLAYRAVKKKTLTWAGAVTGLIVGFLLVGTGLRGLTLFFFYQLGSWATKYKASTKAALDETVATASVRGPSQVLAVSILAVLLSLYHAYHHGPEQAMQFTAGAASSSSSVKASTLAAAILAHHAVSLGDTLASELGMAFASSPAQHPVRLILPPFALVPPGTNGGVTLYGTVWSIVGGLLCGIFTLAMDGISGILPIDNDSNKLFLLGYVVRVTLFAGLCGGLGSLLDSILGATVQMTYWDPETKQVCHHDVVAFDSTNPAPTSKQLRRKHIAGFVPWLSNEGVNFVSVLLTAILGGWVLAPLIIR